MKFMFELKCHKLLLTLMVTIINHIMNNYFLDVNQFYIHS